MTFKETLKKWTNNEDLFNLLPTIKELIEVCSFHTVLESAWFNEETGNFYVGEETDEKIVFLWDTDLRRRAKDGSIEPGPIRVAMYYKKLPEGIFLNLKRLQGPLDNIWKETIMFSEFYKDPDELTQLRAAFGESCVFKRKDK